MYPVPMYSPVGNHAQLTGLSATKTLNVPNNANAIIIQALTQNVRVSLKGAATASVGFQVKAGDPAVLFPVGSAQISIREETASATVEYQFVKVQGLG